MVPTRTCAWGEWACFEGSINQLRASESINLKVSNVMLGRKSEIFWRIWSKVSIIIPKFRSKV